jgi:thiamine biosynthesis lipoprotein
MAERLIRCRPLLGTFVEVTGDDCAAIDAAFDSIQRIHSLMSAHERDSDVSRINRFAHERAVEVDPSTAAVLERALEWSGKSDGAFDIAAAGAAAIESGYLPRHAGQPRPRGIRFDCLEIAGTLVRLRAPACIDVGGIAKGFAVDRAVVAMKAAGAQSGLVNAGGDMAGFGPRPWPVQVVEPASRRAIANLAVTNGAVATSSVQPDGSDAHLHRRSAGLRSATVCAPNATDADVLTKIVLSGSPLAVQCLELAGARAFVIDSTGAIAAVEDRRRAA